MRKMAQQYVENQTQALQDKIEKLGGAKLALSQRLVIVDLDMLLQQLVIVKDIVGRKLCRHLIVPIAGIYHLT
jgi:hypothetical protein